MNLLKKFGKRKHASQESLFPENRWSIGIYQGPSPLQLHPPQNLINPVLSADDITDAEANLVADPFMIRSGNSWHMFFEVEIHTETGPLGKIGYASSKDGLRWQFQQIVLSESFHLSYPYVFTWQEQYFMIPESRSRRSIRLYRAIDFPYNWQFERVLLQKRRFADSTLFYYQDDFWLFTDSGNCTLRLYYAQNPLGPWHEHPRSPLIRKNPATARPGGRVVFMDGRPVRFAQDCSASYGSRVRAFIISQLTREIYQEESVAPPVIAASGTGWNNLGMHTVDPHQLEDGSWIACVDGLAGRK
jgi:hypothetical protein